MHWNFSSIYTEGLLLHNPMQANIYSWKLYMYFCAGKNQPIPGGSEWQPVDIFATTSYQPLRREP